MQSIYSSQNNLNSKRQKDISIDKYDTDSDEEDHRREEEEIKQIILRSRIKANSKAKLSGIETIQNDTTAISKFKQESFTTPNPSVTLKIKNLKGFFPGTMSSLNSVDKRDFSQELERTIEQKLKKPSKFNQKPKDIRALLEVDINYSLEEKESQNLFTKNTEPSTTKLPEIRTIAKNQDFHKESFNNLLHLYAKSTSNKPVSLFSDKNYRSSKGLEGFEIGDFGKRRSKSPLQISFTANGANEEKPEDGNKRIRDIVPDLIAAIVANAWEPLDKKDPYDVPRLKLIDWPAIIKKHNSKKLQLIIIDPINFEIEDFQDIVVENHQEVKDKINDAVKELNPLTNEAKQILVYSYDEANQKKLIFTKFFFFLKNHKFYNKNFKNEKEVIMYYIMILGLLELRANYETNPFKQEKIEASKKKAVKLVRNSEGFPVFVCDWLVNKVQPVMVVEKVYLNLNVGGKADSNFTFSVHEVLAYSFPSIGKILQGQKAANSPQIMTPRTKRNGSDAFVRLNEMKPREIGPLSIPKNSLDTSTRDLKTTQRGTNRSTDPLKKKLEISLSVVDFAAKKEENTSPDAHGKILPQSMVVTQTSPAAYIHQDYQTVIGGRERDISVKRKWPTRLGPMAGEFTKKILAPPSPAAETRTEPKVYLAKQRMNTSYGQLLKHRFAKKNVWSQKL